MPKHRTNLKTMNRDLPVSPTTIKSRHLVTGEHAKLKIGYSFITNGSWVAKKTCFTQGPLLDFAWLRVNDRGASMTDRSNLLDKIFGILRAGAVRYELLLKETSLIDPLVKAAAIAQEPGLVKYKRTRATFQTDFATMCVFLSSDRKEILGIDIRWVDLFSLDYVWRGPKGPIFDNPVFEEVTVYFPDAGRLPEEAAFASYIAGFVPDEVTE